MKIRVAILLIAIFALTMLFLTVPAFHDWATGIQERFKDPVAMREYIASYGTLAPFVSGSLMVLQSIVAPLPAFLIVFVNGLLFGIWWGTALSWSSAMVGAAICFFMARHLGRPIATRLVGGQALAISDHFFEHYGKHAVLIARLIPVVSFDAISYGAGLTNMRFIGFWIATGIGQLPAAILYSYLGHQMIYTIRILFWAFGIVIFISIVAILVRKFWTYRWRSTRRQN